MKTVVTFLSCSNFHQALLTLSNLIREHILELLKARIKEIVLFLCCLHLLHCEVLIWLWLLDSFVVVDLQIQFFALEVRFYDPSISYAR